MGLSAKGEGEVDIGQGVTVEHLERPYFEAFRRFLGINEEEYLESFSKVTGGATNDGGRSGSLYWFNQNKSYLLKSIKKSEMDKLVEMMPSYLEHFQQAKKDGRPCLLCRFCGAYQFTAGDEVLGLLCMTDVWNGQKPDRMYDLKGTTQNRLVDVGDNDVKGVVLKDLNLDSYLMLSKGQLVDSVWSSFEQDAAFLNSFNVIDYSLLLGIDDVAKGGVPETNLKNIPNYQGWEYEEDGEESSPAYRGLRFGIIDFLVNWGGIKKAERIKKNIMGGCCVEHSTMPPDYYANRFVNFMEEKIVVPGEGE
jgi:hypothetical protein